jgi:hypothetical protein
VAINFPDTPSPGEVFSSGGRSWTYNDGKWVLASGPEGPTGPEGATGPTGPAGVAGAVGATGPAGATGPVGATGPAGINGATGASNSTSGVGGAGTANQGNNGGSNTSVSGGNEMAGGGGAGGYRNSVVGETSGANTAAESKITLTGNTSYTVVVGGGGPGDTQGTNSSFSTITSIGGGFGGGNTYLPGWSLPQGGPGGSGGGGRGRSSTRALKTIMAKYFWPYIRYMYLCLALSFSLL